MQMQAFAAVYYSDVLVWLSKGLARVYFFRYYAGIAGIKSTTEVCGSYVCLLIDKTDPNYTSN